MDKHEFKSYLHQQTYDKLYQDIKPIEMIGYSKSFKSWSVIKNLVDWKGATVIDLGCFHGYFCFRIEEAGASRVVGLDAADFALKTTRLIAELENSKVTEFHQWHDGDLIPSGDITLCLNALHHFSDPLACLKAIQSNIAIFEVPIAQEAMIYSVFSDIARHSSHRRGRVILLARK